MLVAFHFLFRSTAEPGSRLWSYVIHSCCWWCWRKNVLELKITDFTHVLLLQPTFCWKRCRRSKSNLSSDLPLYMQMITFSPVLLTSAFVPFGLPKTLACSWKSLLVQMNLGAALFPKPWIWEVVSQVSQPRIVWTKVHLSQTCWPNVDFTALISQHLGYFFIPYRGSGGRYKFDIDIFEW